MHDISPLRGTGGHFRTITRSKSYTFDFFCLLLLLFFVCLFACLLICLFVWGGGGEWVAWSSTDALHRRGLVGLAGRVQQVSSKCRVH